MVPVTDPDPLQSIGTGLFLSSARTEAGGRGRLSARGPTNPVPTFPIAIGYSSYPQVRHAIANPSKPRRRIILR